MKQNQFILSDWHFANPTVDYAFKRIFGTERYKDATINLLNSVITDRHIVDVSFPNTEITGDTSSSRNLAIDVLCEDDKGAVFIVEMQKASQTHFMERSLFYASRVISMTPPKGDGYDYALPPTYVIAFLNFSLRHIPGCGSFEGSSVLHYTTKEDTYGQKMPGSTEFFFLGIADFDKNEDKLETYTEKWLYLLKHSESLNSIPPSYRDDTTFETYFEACARAGFSKDEEQKYTKAMMNEWDIANSKREACEQARAEGIEQGKAEGEAAGILKGKAEGEAAKQVEIAKNLLGLGLDIHQIAIATGLSEAEILNIK